MMKIMCCAHIISGSSVGYSSSVTNTVATGGNDYSTLNIIVQIASSVLFNSVIAAVSTSCPRSLTDYRGRASFAAELLRRAAEVLGAGLESRIHRSGIARFRNGVDTGRHLRRRTACAFRLPGHICGLTAHEKSQALRIATRTSIESDGGGFEIRNW